MSLDDGDITVLVECKHAIDGEKGTVRELDDGSATAFDDVVVGHDSAISTHHEPTALGNWLPSFVSHDDGYDGSLGFLGNSGNVFPRVLRLLWRLRNPAGMYGTRSSGIRRRSLLSKQRGDHCEEAQQ